MKYPLEALLRVRIFREDNAANGLTARRRMVEEAEALVQQRKDELEEYTAWRVNREEELYAEVMEKPVQLKELDELKLSIQMLREREHLYREKILQAEKALQDARESLDQAHKQYQKAVKDRQKIDEHKHIWAQQEAKINEANQEKELEDFRVRVGDDMNEEAEPWLNE